MNGGLWTQFVVIFLGQLHFAVIKQSYIQYICQMHIHAVEYIQIILLSVCLFVFLPPYVCLYHTDSLPFFFRSCFIFVYVFHVHVCISACVSVFECLMLGSLSTCLSVFLSVCL